MHIVLIMQEAPLDPSDIVTGNQERAGQLSAGLTSLGHRVGQLWLDQSSGGESPNNFADTGELQEKINNLAPDCLLFGYWELLEFLPPATNLPVILDFVAPRPLESLFEMPDGIQRELSRLRKCLSRADYFITGSQRQKHLLTAWLIDAGLDLRRRLPVTVVPLSSWDPLPVQQRPPQGSPMCLVSAGVDWPWRRADGYWKAFSQWPGNDAYELRRYSGQYKLHQAEDVAASKAGNLPMQTYQRYSNILWQEADIGLELADANIERYYSQSFRSIGFLEHGLPLICNRYLSLADLIRQHGAGWVVDSPAEFIEVLEQLRNEPEMVLTASRNARQLAENELHISNTIQALGEFLENPVKIQSLAALPVASAPATPMDTRLAVPGFRQRLRKQAALVMRWFCLRFNREEPGDNIVIVSREDLFPTDHGGAVKIVETARGLSRNNRTVAIVSSDRKKYWLVEDGVVSTRKYPFWLRLLALPRMLVELLHRSKDIPASNSFLYLPLSDLSFAWRSIYAAKRHDAGIFQAEFPAYARAAIWTRSVLGGTVVMVEHNVEYLRFKQQLAELTTAQFENLRAIEINLCNQCDAVICVSDNDRHLLIRDGVHPFLLHTIPHGVDLRAIDESEVVDVRERFGIPLSATILVYHGTFAYPPNLDSMHVFAEELLPRLREQGLDVHVLAVGPNPPARIGDPAIHYTGSVEAVAAYLKAADLAVVPLLQGGGTRMKILDYFACGVPVISTRKGIEGIPVENGVEALIEDDWDVMVLHIARLATDSVEAARFAKAARTWVEKLDWTALARDYIKLFNR